MKTMQWCKPYGSLVAIVTPLEDDKLDCQSFVSLIEWHITSGTSGIVVAGTTGEAATMDLDEQIELVEIAVQIAGGRIPIIAGVGSNYTRDAIKLTQGAQAVGADAGLSVTPYYNKPTQKGLFQHYSAIAENCPNFPILVYNVPGRTGVNLLTETLVRLTEANENIVGIKEAIGDMKKMNELLAAFSGTGVSIYSGDDPTSFYAMVAGAQGAIGVVPNVLPAMSAGMWESYLHGQNSEARQLHFQMLPMIDALFCETNPIPTKYALALMGKIAPEAPRLPMTKPSDKNERLIASALKSYDLI